MKKITGNGNRTFTLTFIALLALVFSVNSGTGFAQFCPIGWTDCGSICCDDAVEYCDSSSTCAPLSYCGDGFADTGPPNFEECDGGDLNGETCQSLGYAGGGTLSCQFCSFDTSGCISQVCGNGVPEGTEQCDDGNGVNTDACKNDCTNNVCGDNVRRTTAPAQVCDGSDLGSETCTSQLGTPSSGSLSCSGSCTFVTSSCNRDPVGYQETTTCSSIVGWTCDGDNWGQSLQVDIYDGGTYVTSATANGARSDVASVCGSTTNHGFSVTTPNIFKDGNSHTVNVYAINTPSGTNPLLSIINPRTVNNCILAPTGLNPNGALAQTGSVTLSWNAVAGAGSYYIRADDLTTPAARDPRNNCPGNTNYLCIDGYASNSISLPVTPGHSYNWWVYGYDNGLGPQSAVASFSINVITPTVTATHTPTTSPIPSSTSVSISAIASQGSGGGGGGIANPRSGVNICGVNYACGAQDGICPESFSSSLNLCGTCDIDCGVNAACSNKQRNGPECDTNCQPIPTGSITSTSIYVDGSLARPSCSGNSCSHVSTYPYGTHTYYSTATDSFGTIGTSATGSFSINDAPVTPPVTYSGLCNQGQTITINCFASDVNQPDNTLNVVGWAGECTQDDPLTPQNDCFTSRSWSSGLGTTYFQNAPMTAPAQADGAPFTRTLTITSPSGTAIAATCEATDTAVPPVTSNPAGDAYHLCIVGSNCGAVSFSNIVAAPSTSGPSPPSVIITFTSSDVLAANPVVNVQPGRTGPMYPAAFVSKAANNLDYTYSFDVIASYQNDEARIDIRGTKDLNCPLSGSFADTLTIDTTPPSTTISCNGVLCSQGGNPRNFFNGVSVSFACTDPIAGCQSTFYRINNNPVWSQYNGGTVGLTTCNNNVIDFYSIDAVGNQETLKTQTVSNLAPGCGVYLLTTVTTSNPSPLYTQPTTARVSADIRNSTGHTVEVCTPLTCDVNKLNITTSGGTELDYLVIENLANVLGDSQRFTAPAGNTNCATQSQATNPCRWEFSVDTTVYQSIIDANVSHTPSGLYDEGSTTYNVQGLPQIAVDIQYTDVNKFIISNSSGYPNFTRGMPVRLEVRGTVSGSGVFELCTDANCEAYYAIDADISTSPIYMNYDNFLKAFTAAPTTANFVCDSFHTLTVAINKTTPPLEGALGAAQSDFYVSCTPRVTVDPIERRAAVGEVNAKVFDVTIWNPHEYTTYDLEIKSVPISNNYVLGWLQLEGDFNNDAKITGLEVPAFGSVTRRVDFNSVGAARSGQFVLDFVATDVNLTSPYSLDQYTGTGYILIFAEALPEFAPWQLIILAAGAIFVAYRYGDFRMKNTSKVRTSHSRKRR